MKLSDFINRTLPHEPWAEGENIPWNEPGFSARMLREHLDTEHDAASRRPELIDEQVRWLHEEVLGSSPTRILDLGCGPGLYAVRLAKLGHEVVGVDFSPASLEYARKLAAENGARCEFIEADLREMKLHGEFGLVMQIFGELNVFRRSDAVQIVQKCVATLAPGGKLVLEVDKPETTRERGHAKPVWRSHESGLFSDRPHLYLEESFWNEQERATTIRYWVIDAESSQVTRFAQTFAAYEADEYEKLLANAGSGSSELISGFPADDGKRWMLVGNK